VATVHQGAHGASEQLAVRVIQWAIVDTAGRQAAQHPDQLQGGELPNAGAAGIHDREEGEVISRDQVARLFQRVLFRQDDQVFPGIMMSSMRERTSVARRTLRFEAR